MRYIRRPSKPIAEWHHGFFRPPTVGLLLLLVVAAPFLGDMFGVRHRALASFSDSQSGPLRISSPADSSVVGDGDLILIEGTSLDPGNGQGDRVEVAIDGSDQWQAADADADDSTHWRFLWSDPGTGYHRIRARSLSAKGETIFEQSAIVQVDDSSWSTPFTIDNPYAAPGTYRKGEVHMHTTKSFDGWNSLPPEQDALEYKRRGFQFVITTDHDVVSDASGIDDPTFIAIPGTESTSNDGHITGLFVTSPVNQDLPNQARIDGITGEGGFAILAHPDWQIGWKESDVQNLQGYSAMEVFNGVVTTSADRQSYNLQLWQKALNAKGWANRIWGVAVDDSHDPTTIDKGWIMVKAPQLTDAAIKKSMEDGAFYASDGPSFSVLGVLKDAITASSPDATTIRFIDQDGTVLAQGPGSWAGYRPTGTERWIRVEASTDDGRTAWSQPFWLMPNTPNVAFTAVWGGGMALVGKTIPGARVHISDHGDYLGSVVANDRGEFTYKSSKLASGSHDFWVLPTAPWPDHIEGPPALLSYSPQSG